MALLKTFTLITCLWIVGVMGNTTEESCANSEEFEISRENNGISQYQEYSNCKNRLTTSSGIFFSPSYPDKVKSTLTCEWQIRMIEGMNVRLELTFVNQPGVDHEFCNAFQNDVEIVDCSSNYDQIEIDCIGPTYVGKSSSNIVLIKFNSTLLKYLNAFTLSYESFSSAIAGFSNTNLIQTRQKRQLSEDAPYEGIAIGNPITAKGNTDSGSIISYYSSSIHEMKTAVGNNDFISLKDTHVQQEDVIAFFRKLQSYLNVSDDGVSFPPGYQNSSEMDQLASHPGVNMSFGIHETSSSAALPSLTTSAQKREESEEFATSYLTTVLPMIFKSRGVMNPFQSEKLSRSFLFNQNISAEIDSLLISQLETAQEILTTFRSITEFLGGLEREMLALHRALLLLPDATEYVKETLKLVRGTTFYAELLLASFPMFVGSPPTQQDFGQCEVDLIPAARTIFSSPYYPGDMPPYTECTWNIKPTEESCVIISFFTFSLGSESTSDCSDKARITVWKDISTVGPSYCGTKPLFAYVGKASRIVLQTKSLICKGFVAHVSTVHSTLNVDPSFEYFTRSHGSIFEEANQRISNTIVENPKTFLQYEQCQRTSNETIGIIISPYFAGPLPPYFDCQWDLQAPQNHKILLEFYYFNVGEVNQEGNCSALSDRVTLQERKSTEREFCGVLAPFSLVTIHNAISLSISTLSPSNSSGFLAHYIMFPGHVNLSDISIFSITEFFDKIETGMNDLFSFKQSSVQETENINRMIEFGGMDVIDSDDIPTDAYEDAYSFVITEHNTMIPAYKSNWNENNCRFTLTDEIDYFSSKYMPVSNSACVWTISPNGSYETINLHLTDVILLGLKSHGSCTMLSSYVKITTRDRKQNLVERILCENETARLWFFSAGEIKIESKSNHGQEEGFSAHYLVQQTKEWNISSTSIPRTPQLKVSKDGNAFDSFPLSLLDNEVAMQLKSFLNILLQTRAEYLATFYGIAEEVRRLEREFISAQMELITLPDEEEYFMKSLELARSYSVPFSMIHTFLPMFFRSPIMKKDFDKCNEDLIPTFLTVFSTPYYPGSMPPYTECTWNIKLEKDSSVIINFFNFSLGNDLAYDCHDKSRITVWKDISTVGPSYCGFKPPFTYIGKASRIVLQMNELIGGGFVAYISIFPSLTTDEPFLNEFPFIHENVVEGSEQRISRTIVNNPSTLEQFEQCQRTPYGMIGFIASPYFPGPLPSEFVCQWNIKAPKDYKILIEFSYFYVGKINPRGTCDVSLGKVILRESSTVREFCDQLNPFSIMTTDNELSISITSMSSSNSSGFLAHFIKFPQHVNFSNIQMLSLSEFFENLENNTNSLRTFFQQDSPFETNESLVSDTTSDVDDYSYNRDIISYIIYQVLSDIFENMQRHYAEQFLNKTLAQVAFEEQFENTLSILRSFAIEMLYSYQTKLPSLFNVPHYDDFRDCNIDIRSSYPERVPFSSPFYPGGMPPYTQCSWTLSAPADSFVTIYFLKFSVCEINSSNCTNQSSLVLEDEYDSTMLCGSIEQFSFSGRSLQMHLHTENEVCRGFMAFYVIKPIYLFSPATKLVLYPFGNSSAAIEINETISSFLFTQPTNIDDYDECFRIVTSSFGTIVTPYFPGPLPPDFECQWQITTSHGYRIYMEFITGKIGKIDTNGNCVNGYGRLVIEGASHMSQEKLCGGIDNVTLVSKANVIILNLMTELDSKSTGFVSHFVTGQGHFLAQMIGALKTANIRMDLETIVSTTDMPIGVSDTLTQLPSFNDSRIAMNETERTNKDKIQFGRVFGPSQRLPKPLAPTCGGILFKASGFITTPLFPYFYPTDTVCFWSILSRKKDNITIKFHTFDIDGPVSTSGSCETEIAHKYSHIRISYYNKRGRIITSTYCGSDKPRIIKSFSNRLSIYFKSGMGFGQGFKAEYYTSSVEKKRGRQYSDFINNQQDDCTFRLSTHMGRIQLTNESADSHENCTWYLSLNTTNRIDLCVISLYVIPSTPSEDGCTVNNAALSITTNINNTLNICHNISMQSFALYGDSVVTLNLNGVKIKEFLAVYNISNGIGKEPKAKKLDSSAEDTNGITISATKVYVDGSLSHFALDGSLSQETHTTPGSFAEVVETHTNNANDESKDTLTEEYGLTSLQTPHPHQTAIPPSLDDVTTSRLFATQVNNILTIKLTNRKASTVAFEVNQQITKDLWKNYTDEDNLLSQPLCRRILTAEKGVITFPSRKSKRVDNCLWILSRDKDDLLQVSFRYFNLGEASEFNECSLAKPHLKLQFSSNNSDNSTSSFLFCGNVLPPAIKLNASEITINIRAFNVASNNKGFSLAYTFGELGGGRSFDFVGPNFSFQAVTTNSPQTADEFQALTTNFPQTADEVQTITTNSPQTADEIQAVTMDSPQTADEIQAFTTDSSQTVDKRYSLGPQHEVAAGRTNHERGASLITTDKHELQMTRTTHHPFQFTNMILATFLEEEYLTTALSEESEVTDKHLEDKNENITNNKLRILTNNNYSVDSGPELSSDQRSNQSKPAMSSKQSGNPSFTEITEILTTEGEIHTTLPEKDTVIDYQLHLTLYIVVGVGLALLIVLVGLAFVCVKTNRRNVSAEVA